MPISLPNAVDGQVVTRFPPEPSWHLDIGHCKAALINQHIAQQFKGEWILRFDDTNPKTCSASCVASYLEDLPLLGLSPSRVTHASDYFDLMNDDVVKMIQSGFLYADDTPVEVMRDQRLMKQPSSCRDLPQSHSLAAWSQMMAGSDQGCRFCLRFKLHPGSENGALRDPVAYRVITDPPHYKTGTRFKSYPTYDFAAPWLDAAEGVTHALRTLEFRDRDVLYHTVQHQVLMLHPDWKPATIWEFPRIHMAYTPQAKVHQRLLLSSGLVDRPDDPRLPTLRGLMRAGCHPQALRDFLMEQVTPARKETYHSWDKLWTLNRRLLDLSASRHMAVMNHRRVLLSVNGGPDAPVFATVQWKQGHVVHVVRYEHVWLDQQDAALLGTGDEITLLAWGTVRIDEVHSAAEPAAEEAAEEAVANEQQQQQQQQHVAKSDAACEQPGEAASTPAAAAETAAVMHLDVQSQHDFADALALGYRSSLSKNVGCADQKHSRVTSSVTSTGGSTNPSQSNSSSIMKMTRGEHDINDVTQLLGEQQQPASTVEETAAATLSATATAAKLDDTTSSSSSSYVTRMRGTFIPTGNPKASKLKVHWLPALPDDALLLPLKLVSYSHPVRVERVVEDVDVLEQFDHNSRQECLAWGDPSLLQYARPGTVVQLQRKGLFIVDQVDVKTAAASTAMGLAGNVQVSVPKGLEKTADAGNTSTNSTAGAVLASAEGGTAAVASGAEDNSDSKLCTADIEQIVLFAIPDGHTKHESATL